MIFVTVKEPITDITPAAAGLGIVEMKVPAALRAKALERLEAMWELGRRVHAGDVVVFAAPRSAVEALGPLALRAEALAARHEQLVETLTPPLEIPPPAVLLNARANAELRTRVMREGELLTSAQVAELAKSQATNRASLATSWRKAGKIFAVALGATLYYPAFQLDPDGRPQPVIADVIDLFAEHHASPWSLAIWFLTEHPHLHRQPAELVAEEPQKVLEAARHTFEIPF